MKSKNAQRDIAQCDKDIRPCDTVCWLAIQYEDLKDIKKNSRLAVRVELASHDHQSILHDDYVAAAQDCTEEGYIEVDDNASVSLGTEDGAYVQAWIWVYRTTLDNVPAAKDHKRRQRFVTDTLLPLKKKVTNGKGKKDSKQKDSRKAAARGKGQNQSHGAGKGIKAKSKGKG